MSKRNPVKRNMDKLTKPATHIDRKKASQRGYSKHRGQIDPELQVSEEKPVNRRSEAHKAPQKAFIDGDMILFAAASIGEQIWYVGKSPEGKEIARFDSAHAYKGWLEDIEIFGTGISDGYNPEEITRETEWEILDFEDCKKTFEKSVKQWAKASNCKEYTCYISKASGLKNFRYEVATIKPYKGGREDSHKPHYLEPLRKWAATLDYVKMARGTVEVDDVVCALAQRNGKRGCVVAGDKDSRTVSGCYVLIPGEMEKPAFSSPKIVGKLKRNAKNKVVGLGWLYLMFQALQGDSADNIGGCKGVGEAKAFSLLIDYHNQPIDRLEELVHTVCKEYEKAYGDSFKYTHCITGEELEVSWKEVMIENLHLLYMKKSQSDICPIIKIVEDY